MLLRRFIRPSDKQVENAGGDVSVAKRRMLSWHTVIGTTKGFRIALGNFASVSGDAWWHMPSSTERGLGKHAPLDGGEVGASVTRETMRNALDTQGVKLIQFVSQKLLKTCMEADPRYLPRDEKSAKNSITQDRNYTPTGSLAVVDVQPNSRNDVSVTITQIGDTYVALDTGGRMPWVERAGLWQHPYRGQVVFGTAGPFSYPTLNPLGDTPEENIVHTRFQLQDVTTKPNPRMVLWTNGSTPDVSQNITLERLQRVDAYREQTEMEIIMDNASMNGKFTVNIADIQK